MLVIFGKSIIVKDEPVPKLYALSFGIDPNNTR
jgi:hypothetical protein